MQSKVLIVMTVMVLVITAPVHSLPDCKNRTNEIKPNYEETGIQRVAINVHCAVVNRILYIKDVIKAMVVFEDNDQLPDEESYGIEAAGLVMNDAQFITQSNDSNKMVKEMAMKDVGRSLHNRSTVDSNNTNDTSYDDSRIVFPKDDDVPKNVTLDDRSAINSPDTCPVIGQVRDEQGYCRTPSKLNTNISN